ncbi:MAG: hypothetical protein ACI4D9_03530, partial [Lachnospiraceae bacterium]
MKRKKKSISPRRRRYKRICQLLTLILVLLLATLAIIFLYQKKEALEKEKAKIEAEEKRKIKEKKDKEAKEAIQKAEEEAQKKAEEQEAAEAAAVIINKDVQTAENTATEANHKTNGLAICMYHYVYDKDNPPKKELNSNFIEVHDLEEELKYLVENNYYFPTWEEVKEYVQGELLLPEKSVVLTFDDGAYSFLNLGVPLFNKYKIPVTSF